MRSSEVWISIAPGKRFVLYPEVSGPVDVDNIAMSLSRTARFTGYGSDIYSVAEHSLWASYMAPAGFELEALLHDAHESITGDITRPMLVAVAKIAEGYGIEANPLKDLVASIESYFRKGLGLLPGMPPEVKEVDNRLCVTEALGLGVDDANGIKDWGGAEPYSGWAPLAHGRKAIEQSFLYRYQELSKQTTGKT